MNEIFRELVIEGHVIIYMDNTLILTEDLEEHRTIVKRVYKF